MRSARPSFDGIVRLFVLGAIVGSFFDGFHTFSGTTSYPHPFALRMAWWTPPLFGVAFVLVAFNYALGRPTERPSSGRLAFGVALFGALYFASGFLPASNVVKLGVLLAGAGVLFAVVDRSRAAVLAGLAAMVSGPAFEVVIVHAGAFTHLQPDFLGIPMWLPALYLASGPGIGALAYALLAARDGARVRVAG